LLLPILTIADQTAPLLRNADEQRQGHNYV